MSPYYNTGPVHELPQNATAPGAVTAKEEEQQAAAKEGEQQEAAAPAPTQEDEQEEEATTNQRTAEEEQQQSPEQALPALSRSGQGEPEQVSAFQHGPLRLNGRTDATYDGGSYETVNVRVRPATGCTDCSECVHVTGTLVARYSVSTTVTLPGVADFPDLTECQRRRVQNAIDTVLAPHEQEHVRAFQRYNGTTRRPFNLTLCRSEFDAAIESMFQAEEQSRRQAAQAASDALDPFNFDVDLDCEEPRASLEPEQPSAETPPEEEEVVS